MAKGLANCFATGDVNQRPSWLNTLPQGTHSLGYSRVWPAKKYVVRFCDLFLPIPKNISQLAFSFICFVEPF